MDYFLTVLIAFAAGYFWGRDHGREQGFLAARKIDDPID